jgi:hypothetical protein
MILAAIAAIIFRRKDSSQLERISLIALVALPIVEFLFCFFMNRRNKKRIDINDNEDERHY